VKRSLDPFDILRKLNPVNSDSLPGAGSSEGRALLERISAESDASASAAVPGVLRNSRRRVYVLVLVGAVVVGAGAAAWALTRTETKHLTIGCYASTDLQANTLVIPASTASPVIACRELWREGAFGSEPTPRLQACVLASGAVGVFPSPSGQACRRLGLVEAAPGRQPGAAAGVGLKDALVDRFLAAGCVSEVDAIQIVRSEFRQRHLTAWQVRAADSFSTARPCATLAFEEERHLVLLVPATRP
jgi:hypothetical protein